MLNKKILILTGACGVGKSTLGKLWAKEKKGVCIEGDAFTNWIYDNHPITTPYFLEIEPMTALIAWQCCKTYLDHGFSVAMECVWNPKALNQLKKVFDQNQVSVTFVYLSCDLGKNENRDQQRTPDCMMNERVGIVKSELEAYDWPSFVHKIDSSGQTSEETLNAIVHLK